MRRMVLCGGWRALALKSDDAIFLGHLSDHDALTVARFVILWRSCRRTCNLWDGAPMGVKYGVRRLIFMLCRSCFDRF